MATLGWNEDDKSSLEVPSWARLVSTHAGMANFDIVKDEVVIGRREDADIVVKDGAISNSHCRLWKEDVPQEDQDSNVTFHVYLEDLSKNGTFIRDQKIGRGNKVRVTSGTEIALIPRGPRRRKVSYMLYIPSQEEQEPAPEGEVTFVFTDIQGSTTLWEKAPEAMNDALKKHDGLLRRLMRRHRGYEVKTEGDAFMVSFFSVLDAIRWCLDVQQALIKAEWPEALLAIPSAATERDQDGRKLFHGLRVRMGVHVGQPNCRRNPVTGRMDYFGPVVNRAARVSDSAHGGQIVVTDAVSSAFEKAKIKGDFATECPEQIEIKELGLQSYKGINELVQVYQIFSPDLATRQFPPLRTEQSKGRKKSMQGHKLLAEERKDFLPVVPNVTEQENEAEEVYSCANPECIKQETADHPFGACARCKQVKYCGVDCQKKHWKIHRKECKAPEDGSQPPQPSSVVSPRRPTNPINSVAAGLPKTPAAVITPRNVSSPRGYKSPR